MDEGFRKITLNHLNVDSPEIRPLAPNTAPTPKRKGLKKKIFFPIAILLAVFLFVAALVAIPINMTVASIKKTETSAKKLSSALKNQNIDEAKQYALETKVQVQEIKKNYHYLSSFAYLPLLGPYYRDGEHSIVAADAGLDALISTIDSLLPYADILGLKGKGTFSGGSADERIKMAIVTFEKVIPNLGAIGEKVQIVKEEIGAIDPNRYPDKIGNTVIKSRLLAARDLTETVTTLFLSARPLLEELPDVFGASKSKHYLVLFQNDKELRPTGGFITAYALFKVDGGKPTVEKADDIYKLDDSRKKKTGAPPEILKYHKGVYYFNLRDSNVSPDFVLSMKQFETLYEDVSDPVEYDGIITVDTHVLVKAIEILGPFVVYGRTFDASNDPRCNCPRAIYELEEYSTKPVAYVREERKDIIGVLLLQIMQKALGVSPGQYWGRLFQMMLSELNEKHILVYLKNDKAQTGIEALNWAGRIKPYDGDYLQITDTNYAGAKSDLFVKRSVRQEIAIGNDGSVVKTVTIEYKNPAPPSDCNLETGGLCLNGLLRNWVRLYIPKGSMILASSGGESPKDDGSPLEVVAKEELDKTVLNGYLRVRPLSASKLVIKYSLPFKVDTHKPYPLLIQKQPGTEDNEHTIAINGRQLEKIKLNTDKELKIKF